MAHYYVATTGLNTNDGLTLGTPFATIPHAASVAGAGDTVTIIAGYYPGSFQTTVAGAPGNPVTFQAAVGGGVKILPPTGSSARDYAWDSRGDYVVIDGIEVDGSTDPGSGTKWRVGIGVAGEGSVVQNCHVHHIGRSLTPSSAGGAGILLDSYYGKQNMQALGNLVHHVGPASAPTSIYYQGIYQTASGKIWNNISGANTGGGIHCWHDARHIDIANNTVFANGTWGIVFGGGDYVHLSAPCDYITVTNNIVYGNTTGIRELGDIGSHNVVSNNLCFANTTDYSLNVTAHSADLHADPLFVSYAADASGDYRLQSGSPAINAGLATYAPSVDCLGNARPVGGAFDLGAYEWGSGGGGGGGGSGGAPANDDIANATVLSGASGSIAGSCTGATAETDEYYTGEKTVWYSWTPSAGGAVSFAATGVGGGVVSALSVFKGATQHDLNYYGSPIYGGSSITVGSAPGVTFHIGVYMEAPDTAGDFVLTWNQAASTVDGVTVTALTTDYDPLYSVAYLPTVDELWLMNDSYPDGAPAITRISPASGATLGHVTASAALSDPFVYDAYGARLWVGLDSASPHVAHFDPASHAESAGLTGLAGLEYGNGFAPLDGTFWKSTGSYGAGATDGAVVQYNAASGAVLATIALGGPRADNICFADNGTLWLYSPDNPAGAVVHVNPATSAVTAYDLATSSPARQVRGFVSDDDLNVLWVLREGAAGTTELVRFHRSGVVQYVYGGLDWQNWGGYYGMIAYDPHNQLVWLNSNDSTWISAYNTFDGSLAQRTALPAGYSTGPITVTPNAVFVEDSGYHTLFRVSLRVQVSACSGLPIAIDTFALDNGGYDTVYNPARAEIWSEAGYNADVGFNRIDPASGAVTGLSVVSSGGMNTGRLQALYCPVRQRIYAGGESPRNVLKFDAASGSFLGATADWEPYCYAIHPVTGNLWGIVGNGVPIRVQERDAVTDALLRSVAPTVPAGVPGAGLPEGVLAFDKDGILWISSFTDLIRFDPADNSFTSLIATLNPDASSVFANSGYAGAPASTKWRINIASILAPTAYPASGIVITEIQMRETAGVAQLFAGGTVTASADANTGSGGAMESIALAADGMLGSGWVCPEGVTAAWWQYEFASPVRIAEYTIRGNDYSDGGRNTPQDFTLEYWDGSGWVVSDTRSTTTADWHSQVQGDLIWGMTYDPVRHALWYTALWGQMVRQFDIASMSVVRTLEAVSNYGSGSAAAAIRYDSYRNVVWLLHDGSDTLKAINPITGEVWQTIMVRPLTPNRLAFAPDALWLNDGSGVTIERISGGLCTATASVPTVSGTALQVFTCT